MCPMRFFLVFFSVILAGFVAWKSIGSGNDGSDSIFSEDSDDLKVSANDRQNRDMIKMVQNGFWVFVDMASGKYLWKALRSGV
ncbi:hypothetical protein DCAR_0626621 [Daucus carota subsp. sativus]|uniref:Methyltransferase-related protein n=1 Tax=Daucus carota subsp. sativus TaxID=79200 RepID=A0A164X670_DAUCS|nr:PREDICTED: uncharacterized protein LOC108225708 [Daucus carota subsp. sativus]WOH07192.1 hypothetical protein DCAR_0626621 [Daucus carota subsp. sativus]